jgi:hypothetical protein
MASMLAFLLHTLATICVWIPLEGDAFYILELL